MRPYPAAKSISNILAIGSIAIQTNLTDSRKTENSQRHQV